MNGSVDSLYNSLTANDLIERDELQSTHSSHRLQTTEDGGHMKLSVDSQIPLI